MNHKDLPENSSVIQLYITEEGEISGELAWKCSKDLDEELVDALVDATNGLMVMVTNNFDELVELGRAFSAGMNAKAAEEQAERDAEFEAECKAKNVIPLTSSNRKH